MPSQDGNGNADNAAAGNAALTDEIEALNSIYDPGTLVVQNTSAGGTTAVLRLPKSGISFLISFRAQYPDVPPQILGTQSTGDRSRKGEGDVAVNILRDVLARAWTEGQVCLFDLVEEASPLLSQHHEEHTHEVGTVEDHAEHAKNRSASPPPQRYAAEQDHDPNPVSDAPPTAIASHTPPPNWTLSDTLTVNKSTFVARACPAHSLEQAQSSLSHLLATNKKVAASPPLQNAASVNSGGNTGGEIVVQDSDDDGETAAGGRLLHLLQLMDVWNVLVVVSRWYGGVKLGPDRFRLINQVAREVLVKGGFAKEHVDGENSKMKGKGKGKGKK